MKKRIVTMLMAVLFVLGAGFPPAANATNNLITGACTFLEEIHPPEMTLWRTGEDELHIRNKLLKMECDFSDDRLDGSYQSTVNWDVREFYDPFYYVIGPDYGLMHLLDEDGNAVWQGTREVAYMPPRTFSGKVILSGRGDYADMIARFDVWGDLEESSLMQFAGRIDYNLE